MELGLARGPSWWFRADGNRVPARQMKMAKGFLPARELHEGTSSGQRDHEEAARQPHRLQAGGQVRAVQRADEALGCVPAAA